MCIYIYIHTHVYTECLLKTGACLQLGLYSHEAHGDEDGRDGEELEVDAVPNPCLDISVYTCIHVRTCVCLYIARLCYCCLCLLIVGGGAVYCRYYCSLVCLGAVPDPEEKQAANFDKDWVA